VLLTSFRLEDEAALLAKVNEAMAVYDEYVKSQQGAGAAPGAGPAGAEADKSKEEKAEEKA
jgi:polyadenylate-binding protein